VTVAATEVATELAGTEAAGTDAAGTEADNRVLERVERVSDDEAWRVTDELTRVETTVVATGVVEAATEVGVGAATLEEATVEGEAASEEETAAQISPVTSIAVSASAVEQPFKTQGVAAA